MREEEGRDREERGEGQPGPRTLAVTGSVSSRTPRSTAR